MRARRWLALLMIALSSLAAGALHADELVLFLPPIAINLGLALFLQYAQPWPGAVG